MDVADPTLIVRVASVRTRPPRECCGLVGKVFIQRVGARAAVVGIIALSAVQIIIAGPAFEGVVPAHTVEAAPPTAGLQGVVSAVSIQEAITRECRRVEGVWTGGALQIHPLEV